MWHIRFSATDIRKGTFEQLQALAAKGKISPEMGVKAPDSQKWVKASSVPGLFPPVEEELTALDDDPLSNLAAFEPKGAASPLGATNPLGIGKSAPKAADNTQLLIYGGIGGGALVVLLLIVVIVVAMSGGSNTPVAVNPAPLPQVPVAAPTPTVAPVSAPTTPAPTTVAPPVTTPAVVTTPATTPAVTAPPPSNPMTVATSSPPPATTPATTTPAPASPETSAVEMTLPQLIEHAQPSIVRIDVQTQLGGSVGSGFVVDSHGTVVTNLHVVAGGKAARLTFADKSVADVTHLLVVSKEKDIAIIRFDATKHPSKPIAIATKLPSAGESVAAFGAPKGLSFTTSNGIISAVRNGSDLKQFGAEFDPTATILQTSAPISPGNSGGPLVSMKGQVVGINTSQLSSGQNLNFAVSCLDVKMMLDSVKDARPLTDLAKYEPKPTQAISFKDIAAQQKEALKLPELVEEEWTIVGKPVKGTLVSVVTTDKEPRKAIDLDAKDFVNGKYTTPKGLKVRLKLEDGTEKDFFMSQFNTEGMKKAKDRWHDEVYACIKRKLVNRGNDRIQSLFIAAEAGDGGRVTGAARSLAMLYCFGDAAMPKEHSNQIRKLVSMNFDVIPIEGEKDRLTRAIGDMESSLRAQVKNSPELGVALADMLKEMLSQPE